MNANVEYFVDQVYLELKADFPGVSEFRLKTAILDKLRQKATEQADLMIETAQLAAIVKDLSALAQLL